jgi:hypothetical protein
MMLWGGGRDGLQVAFVVGAFASLMGRGDKMHTNQNRIH